MSTSISQIHDFYHGVTYVLAVFDLFFGHFYLFGPARTLRSHIIRADVTML